MTQVPYHHSLRIGRLRLAMFLSMSPRKSQKGPPRAIGRLPTQRCRSRHWAFRASTKDRHHRGLAAPPTPLPIPGNAATCTRGRRTDRRTQAGWTRTNDGPNGRTAERPPRTDRGALRTRAVHFSGASESVQLGGWTESDRHVPLGSIGHGVWESSERMSFWIRSNQGTKELSTESPSIETEHNSNMYEPVLLKGRYLTAHAKSFLCRP